MTVECRGPACTTTPSVDGAGWLNVMQADDLDEFGGTGDPAGDFCSWKCLAAYAQERM